MGRDKILILTVPHGAAHTRLAAALREALGRFQPAPSVEIVNALEYCTGWFRIYYNSYQLPLEYWPALWGWIEGFQHTQPSTGPAWLYRRGARPLFTFLQTAAPELVVVTEAGLCEMAALFKRQTQARFPLVAVPTGIDLDRAWAQPEVDLYAVAPEPPARRLESWGIPRNKILPCGVPVDPAFEGLPDRLTARERLGLDRNAPLVLIAFGGTGVAAHPDRLMRALKTLRQPFQLVALAGRNTRLQRRLERYRVGQPNLRVLGWANNIHLWMDAADLLIGKPGGNTVFEALNCGLPLLILDPLPGSQRRTCAWLESQRAGRWIKRPEELPGIIQSLWRNPQEIQELRLHALAASHRGAAGAAAEAILKLLSGLHR